MFTSEGKNHVRRYLAQFVPSVARAIAIGVGQQSEALAHTSLQFETGRSSIHLTTFDFANNKLLYRAEIPSDFAGIIYEVGLYTLETDPAAAGAGSRMITTFDSATEDWVDPVDGLTPATYTNVASRIGSNSLNLAPTASTSMSETRRALTLDLSLNSAADSLVFAYNVGNANATALQVHFMTDSGNYYTFSMPSPGVPGYKVTDIPKGAAGVTGSPDWAKISEIRVSATSGPNGTSAIEWDGIRVEDRDTNNLDYVLVARKVLATPIIKRDGEPQDIEFTLDVTL